MSYTLGEPRYSRQMSFIRATLSATPLPSDELPSEFLIFRYGINSNYNNEAKGQPQPVFTKRSAAKLIADAKRRGADYLIDLAHRSVDTDAKRASADATNAMGWAKLALRPDGLYALVTWTPEGARRLRAKSQRYTSPCFLFDGTSGEITELVNVALVSDPATFGAQALVAASRTPTRAVIVHESLTSPLTVKLSASARTALCLAAEQRGVTLSQLARAILAAAPNTPEEVSTDQPLTPADLAEMLGLDPDASGLEILDAVKALLAAADAVDPVKVSPPKRSTPAPSEAPIDPAAGAADPPQPAALSRDLAAKRAAMDPIQRAKFDRMRASMARDVAAQQRGTGAVSRPLSRVTAAKVAAMDPVQRAKFDRMQANFDRTRANARR